MSSTKSSTESAVKHRACDECRQRKLACSKDPGGCERCKRESIVCHYSEQKPMGRPRKRQFVEATRDEAANHISNISQDPRLLVDSSPDDFDFNTALAEPYFTATQPPTLLPDGIDGLHATKTDNGRVLWQFGNRDVMVGPAIQFGEIDFGTGEDSVSTIDPAPQLSTISNPSLTDSESSPPQTLAAAAPCSCLASMYLALASLQQFPTDIVTALATVRGAAATASASLWCPQCGSVLLDGCTAPIESFQNTMLLGTILPIIANGYGRLLKMIDVETDNAVATGQMKTFRFHDYGGMCGRQETVQQTMSCVEKELVFNAVEMPPMQWRTTVRALLRVDIYGHEQPGFKHKGLKDLVAEMEYRQRTRHEVMDAQLADGTLDRSTIWHGFSTNGNTLCLGEKTRGCLEILKMAKVAIDGLVIA